MRSKAIFLTTDAPNSRDRTLVEILQEHLDLELLSGTGLTTEPMWKRLLSPLMKPGELSEELRNRAEPGKLLWLSGARAAKYVPYARDLGYRVILDGQVVQKRFCVQSDALVAPSELDASRLHKLAPSAEVHVIPHAVDCDAYDEIRGTAGKTLYFPALLELDSHRQGALWFIDEILPRLRSHLGRNLPPVVISGTDPDRGLWRAARAAGVEFETHPERFDARLGEASLVFFPLQNGQAGFPLLHAMAAERAVVSTGRGTGGLIVAPSYDLWVAEGADAFASGILRLLANPELRRELASHALQTVRTRYDRERARTMIARLLAALAGPVSE
ncbi:MAG: glycosyltransferase family 4 protein [Bdellovibrionota bacterium]